MGGDAILVLDGIEMDIGQLAVFVRKPGHFEIMGGKQRQATVLVDQVTEDGKGQCHAVKG